MLHSVRQFCLVLLVAGAALLAACGGGKKEDNSEYPPRLSQTELEAALAVHLAGHDSIARHSAWIKTVPDSLLSERTADLLGPAMQRIANDKAAFDRWKAMENQWHLLAERHERAALAYLTAGTDASHWLEQGRLNHTDLEVLNEEWRVRGQTLYALQDSTARAWKAVHAWPAWYESQLNEMKQKYSALP